MRIKLDSSIQRSLIDNYKSKFNLDWQSMAKLLRVGKSTLRSKYRNGTSMPIELFEELARELSKEEREVVRSKGAIVVRNFNSKRSSGFVHTDRQKISVKIRKKYGMAFYSKIGSKGSQISKVMWDIPRRIRQSFVGINGGRERIRNATYLTKQEEQIAQDNELMKLSFKSNYFIQPDLNFDFVYFKGDKPIAVEEVTYNIFRGFTYLLRKREMLSKLYGEDFPFILTVASTKRTNSLLNLLLKKRMFVFADKEDRWKFIQNILDRENTGEVIEGTRLRLTVNEEMRNLQSVASAKLDQRKQRDNYEEIVHQALQQLGLNPQGKYLLSNNDFRIVPDNRFFIDDAPVNVLVSCCNSRGSLFYQLYRAATYSYLIKNIFREKVMSVLFDFSNTASGLGCNVPKTLWETNCDYPIITFKKDSSQLIDAVKTVLHGPVA